MLFFFKSPNGLSRALSLLLNALSCKKWVLISSILLLGMWPASHLTAHTTCIKPNAGKDTTICITSIQLKAPAQDETWAFLSSNNGNTASVTQGGLATGLSVSGQYKFVLKKTADANCSDTITVTRANFLLPQITDKDICPGTTLTFGYQGLSGVTYAWSTGATTPTISVSPTQTTDYKVTVTSGNTGCQVKDTITVAVNPKPNAGKDTVVCVSTAKLAAVGSGETWSFLSFNDPSNPSNTSTATINQQGDIAGLTKAGFYRFVLTNAKQCTDTIRVQRRVITLPKFTLNPICPGSTLTFGYQDSTNFSYAWNTGATTAQLIVKPNSSTNYIVTATELSTKCQGIDTVKVIVKPAPTLTLVSSVCSSDNAKYITTVTVSSGAVVTSNAGVVSGSGTSFMVTVGSDTTGYTITATLDGCKTRLDITKPDCTCPQIASPTAQGTAICTGTTASLTASGCPTGTTAKWYSNANLTSEIGSGNGFTTPTLTQPIDYYVACVYDAKPACKSSGVKVAVTINPKPTFLVEAKNPICQGGTALNNGSVQIVTGTVGNSYAFNTTGFGTLPTGTSSATAIASFPVNIAQNIANNTATITYYIRVFGSAGCYKDTSVSVHPQTCQPNCPTITLIGQNSSNEACSGPLYLYAGSQIGVKTNSLDSIRFVYFTGVPTNPYTGGVVMATVKPQADSIAALDQGLPGLQSSRFPINTGNGPITYYVYAIQKNFAVGTACLPPSAFRTYTLNPVPKFTLDSIPACVGDTTYKVNVKISSSGTFKVIVATGLASIGNGPNPTGILQTIENVAGTTQLILKTTDDIAVFVQDVKGCISFKAAPKPSFKPCNGTYDLALSKTIDKKTAQVGDAINYTIKVWNEGTAPATNVAVRDTLSAGVEYITYATAFGNYNAATKIWNIGTLAVGDTAVLLLAVKVVAQGVWFNVAEICSMTEKDEDSTPCNGNEEEDDIDRECFSVPLEVCSGEAIQASVPSKYTDVKWFKDGGTTVVATGNDILISEPGTYTFTALSNTCPAHGCCPIIVIAGTNCCPPDLCIPFTIKKTKKGSKPL